MSKPVGRPPKPRNMHLVDGTFRPDRHGNRDDARQELRSAAKARRPPPPTWLKSAARNEWDRLAPLIHSRGCLTPEDAGALAAYCRAYAQLIEAEEDIQDNGITVPSGEDGVKQNPSISTAASASKQMAEWASKLGLTPVDRMRLATPKAPEADPLAEMESKRKAREARGADR